MEEQLYDELLVELECPICTNYMSPPIRQCATGHSICENCRKKLPKCALCQGKFTESRNLSLEGLAVKMRYPCMNKSLGCNAKLSYCERETHDLRCPLKGFKCAMEKCPWIGKFEELKTHWATKKMSSKIYSKNNVCHTKMKAESYYVNMVDAHNQLFWFKCKLLHNKIYWALQFIGNAVEAENFYYEIEIIKPGRTKRKVLLSDYCQSVELENSQLFTDDTCININTDSINHFVSPDQLLIYYMRVYSVKNDNIKTAKMLAATATTAATASATTTTTTCTTTTNTIIKKPPQKQRDHSKGPNKNQKKKQQQNTQNQNDLLLL